MLTTIPEVMSTSYFTGRANEASFNRTHWAFGKLEKKKFTLQNYTTVEGFDFKFYVYRNDWVGAS